MELEIEPIALGVSGEHTEKCQNAFCNDKNYIYVLLPEKIHVVALLFLHECIELLNILFVFYLETSLSWT